MRRRTISLVVLAYAATTVVVIACASDEAAINPVDNDAGASTPTATATNSPPPPAADSGAPDAALPEPTIRLTAHNDYSTCVTKKDGSVLCWGGNLNYGLGRTPDGGGTADPVPGQVPGLAAATASASGFGVHCGVGAGSVACWGLTGGPGQCNINGIARGADGGPVSVTTGPVAVGITGAEEVASHAQGGCARVGTDVRCWGHASTGTLGAFDAGGGCSPPAGNAFTSATAVDSLQASVCALKADGTVWCWGFATGYGEFGRQTDAGPDASGVSSGATAPVQVRGLSSVRSLGVGYVHACVVKTDSTVWCWGLNGGEDQQQGGQLGHVGGGFICNGYPCDSDPKPVEGLTGVREVSAGVFHTCAVKNDDTVVCWGASSARDLLGHNPNDDRDAAADAAVTDSVAQPQPRVVKGLSNVAHVSSGIYHTCAVTRDDKVYCWGSNQYRALGPNAAIDAGPLSASYDPIEVPLP